MTPQHRFLISWFQGITECSASMSQRQRWGDQAGQQHVEAHTRKNALPNPRGCWQKLVPVAWPTAVPSLLLLAPPHWSPSSAAAGLAECEGRWEQSASPVDQATEVISHCFGCFLFARSRLSGCDSFSQGAAFKVKWITGRPGPLRTVSEGAPVTHPKLNLLGFEHLSVSFLVTDWLVNLDTVSWLEAIVCVLRGFPGLLIPPFAFFRFLSFWAEGYQIYLFFTHTHLCLVMGGGFCCLIRKLMKRIKKCVVHVYENQVFVLTHTHTHTPGFPEISWKPSTSLNPWNCTGLVVVSEQLTTWCPACLVYARSQGLLLF